MLIDMPLAEMKSYLGSSPRPEDFDRYWADSLAELEATPPEQELMPAKVQAPNAPFYAEVKTELGRTYQKLLLDPSLDVAAEVKACGEAIQNIIDNNA